MLIPESRRSANAFFRRSAAIASVVCAFAAALVFYPVAHKVGRVSATLGGSVGEGVAPTTSGATGWFVLLLVMLSCGVLGYLCVRIVGWWVHMKISQRKYGQGMSLRSAYYTAHAEDLEDEEDWEEEDAHDEA